MSNDMPNTTRLLIDRMDAPTRDTIFRFEKKLRVMNFEVEAKLDNMMMYRGADPMAYKTGLLNLQQEVKSALDVIHFVTTLELDPDLPDHPLLQGNAMAELNEQIIDKLEKMEQMKLL